MSNVMHFARYRHGEFVGMLCGRENWVTGTSDVERVTCKRCRPLLDELLALVAARGNAHPEAT